MPWQRVAGCWRANPALSAVVGLALLIGLLLRLYVLGRIFMNSDEAVVGLMAREILHGHFFAFYWGVNYGGTEAYVVAVVFALFGSSPFTLVLTTVLLSAAALVPLWRIGNRLFGSPVGAAAAIAFWVWPESYATYFGRGDGFRRIILICGLIVLLTVLRIGDGEGRTTDWIALGLSAGVGWWSSPEIAYYLAPAGIYLVARIIQRRAKLPLVPVLLGVGALILGSLPWWWHNLNQHFDSFAGSPRAPAGAYWSHLGIFDRYAVPLVLGLRIRGSGQWLEPSNLTPHVVNVLIVVLLGWLVYLAVRGRAVLLLLFVAAFPFIYAAQPYTGFWRDARYAIFLAPAAALVVASFVCQIGTWAIQSRRFAPAIMVALVLAGGLTLTLDATTRLVTVGPVSVPAVERTSWFSWHSNPNNLPTELADSLIRWHVHDAFSSYWLGYVVAFLAQGRVTVSPAGPAFIRYPPYYASIAASPAPAWIFVSAAGEPEAGLEAGTGELDPGCILHGPTCLLVPDLVHWCVTHHISYQIRYSGPYVVVLPARLVLPTQILPFFGI